MSNLVIPAPKQITIPIHGSDQEFPVRRIYCIGRNYAAHTIEMGFDPDKEPPFFFQKNTDNIDISGEFPYPPESKDVHYEQELIVALKSGGSNISEEDAYNHIYGFGIGLDMTRRDLQGVCKKMVGSTSKTLGLIQLCAAAHHLAIEFIKLKQLFKFFKGIF